MDPSIIYEDEDILVANKPPGLLAIPDRFDPNIPSLLHLLGKQQKGSLLTVHRLDRPTSGLLVFAKNKAAQSALSQQFEQRSVEKTYLALVDGKPLNSSGSIAEPIAPHPAKLGKMMVSSKGKTALTDYLVLESFGNYSLLEVNIHTGRTHQIRVHLAFLGHPLLVDPDYGHREHFYLSSLKGKRFNIKKETEEQPILSRVPLHAHQLVFTHPSSGEPCAFRCEPPKDMAALCKQLRKLSR